MSKKSQCSYIYVNGVRVPTDSVFVEYVEYGQTVRKRLVQYGERSGPDGGDSVRLADYKKFLLAANPEADLARVPVFVKTPRGDVTGLVIDLDFAFSSKGRRLSPPKVGETYYGGAGAEEPLTAENAAKLAELSLRGLSYGRNHSAKHAERVRWTLEHAAPGAVQAWVERADQRTLQEDNYHSFVINLVYLRRKDPAYVEAFFRDNPSLRSRIGAMIPLLEADTDIAMSISAAELSSFKSMLEAGGAVSSRNESEVESVIQDGMRQAGTVSAAPGASPTILRRHAEDMVQRSFALVELVKRSSLEGLLGEGRSHALSLLQTLSVILNHPRAGGYPLVGAPGELIAPMMGSGGRRPSPIDAFRGRDRFSPNFAAQILDRLPARLAEVKHYDPVRFTEANFGPRPEGNAGSYDNEYATSAPIALVELFELLAATMAIPDPGPVVGMLRDAPTDASRQTLADLEQREQELEKSVAVARAEYEAWRSEAAIRKEEYERCKTLSSETFSTLTGLRNTLESRKSALLQAEVADGHRRLTSSEEFGGMVSSYGGKRIAGTFVAHTGSEVWVRLADHGESDSVQFTHSQDVGSFYAVGSQWNREKKGKVIEIEFHANRSAVPSNVTVHFPPTYQSTARSQETRRAAAAAFASAERALAEAEERLQREYQARDAANAALTQVQTEFYAASTKLTVLEQSLEEVRSSLEAA